MLLHRFANATQMWKRESVQQKDGKQQNLPINTRIPY